MTTTPGAARPRVAGLVPAAGTTARFGLLIVVSSSGMPRVVIAGLFDSDQSLPWWG
ncbi:hypothetical protein ABT023_08720 [Micromonospora sp. NPDC002296]|uniref:hypothetical protein n=1 Tax=Micromonospora sp. NPDC002296 TaxID=3154271 RepID=UPI00331A2732